MKRIFALFFCLMLLPIAALAEEQIITITCTGDTTLGSSKRVQTKYYEASYQYYIEQNGYAYPFDGIRHLTENDDITLVNLEGVLYVPKELNSSHLVFNGPQDYAKILSAGSVEVVNLANNHTDDYGKAGYQSTVEALEAEGIKHSGAIEPGRSICWFDFENDVRVGFIGLIPSYYSKNQAKVNKDMQALKDAGCDVIIASIHCGKEENLTHSDMTTTYRKKATALGANIIVGTHPHVPQGIHVEKGITTLYSLGNFSFGGNTGVNEVLYSPQSIVVQLHLHFEDGIYTGHHITIWPIMTTGAEEGSGIEGKGYANDYRPILVEGEQAQRIMRQIQKDTAFELNPYVDGQGAVQDFVPWTGK